MLITVFGMWQAMQELPVLPASWRELRTGKAGEVRYHLFAA